MNKITSVRELFEAYKKFVSENPQTVSDLETTAKWISYFVAGRISDSSITSELVYALSNILVFCNDRIIENGNQANKKPQSKTHYQLKVMLTTLEYCEVLIELSSKRLWGKKGRWFFIAALQIVKSATRFILYKDYMEPIIQSPPIKVLERKKIEQAQAQIENSSCMPDETTNGINDFKLRRCGRTIRKIEGSPPLQFRKWEGTQSSQCAQDECRKMVKYAEYLYIAKPIIHLGAVSTFGYKSWKSYSIALFIDLLSIHLYYRNQQSMTKEQKVELSRRCVNLLLYLVRSPFFEYKTESSINGFLNFLASHIPFAKSICTPVMQYIPTWQSSYFYMWST